MAESLQRIQTNSNIMMDVGGGGEKEETVEELIRKLQNRGTRVKILADDEEATKQTPKQKSPSKKPSADKKTDKQTNDIHNLVDRPDPADKENAPQGARPNEAQAASDFAAGQMNNPDDVRKLAELQR